jgi:hypothetical protein
MNEIKVSEQKTPAELIALAVGTNTDLEKLEKLLTLQERWEAREAQKAYNKAMAAFKENPPKIEKDKTVKIPHKDGHGVTTYNHATLANVTQTINAELSKYGLNASWRTKQNGTIEVTCRISHSAGHFEETTLSAPADSSGSKNSIQAIGSTVTYLERYTLLAITGLAAEEQDDDGKSSGVPMVSEEELLTLNDWMVSAGKSKEQVCEFLKINDIKEMTKPMYSKVLSSLKATSGKKGAK